MISLLDDYNDFIEYLAKLDENDYDAMDRAKNKFKDVTIMGIHLAAYKDPESVLKNGLIPYSNDMCFNRKLLIDRLESYGYPKSDIDIIVEGCMKELQKASDRYSNNIVNKVCFSFDEACISTSSRSAFLDYLGGELVCRFLHNNNISSINGDPYAVYAAIPFERLSDTVIGYIVNICKGRVEKDEINASNYTLDFSVEGIIEPELIKLVRKI